jgi:spore maturation protein CgeB
LLNRCKTFLNTPSALGIVNTRFWELMATKTLVICPEDDYFGLLTNGENCVMYEDLAEFDELLEYYVTHNDARRDIVENAAEFVTQFSWETIVSDLMTTIDSAESG